jgi:hypothetical protein
VSSGPDDAVLGPKWNAAEESLQRPERCQKPWEIEEENRAIDSKAAPRQESSSIDRRKHNGIAIEGNAPHYEPSAWIPGIVFPKREDTPGLQALVHVPNGVIAICWRNVVKNSVAERNIELRRPWKRRDLLKLHAIRMWEATRVLEQPCGHIHADIALGAQN